MTNPTEQANPFPHTCGLDPAAPLLPEFVGHRLNADGEAKAQVIRQAMSYAMQVVEGCCPTPSRERSIVVTKLQEAAMFACRAVCLDVANQVQP